MISETPGPIRDRVPCAILNGIGTQELLPWGVGASGSFRFGTSGILGFTTLGCEIAMADDSRKGSGIGNVSPYLERPLRSLAQAELDHRMLRRSDRVQTRGTARATPRLVRRLAGDGRGAASGEEIAPTFIAPRHFARATSGQRESGTWDQKHRSRPDGPNRSTSTTCRETTSPTKSSGKCRSFGAPTVCLKVKPPLTMAARMKRSSLRTSFRCRWLGSRLRHGCWMRRPSRSPN